MKNLSKTIAILFFASVTTFANSHKPILEKEDTELKFGMYFNQSSEKIRTFYEKAKGEKLKVKFISVDGKVISQTVIAKNITRAQLDLNVSYLDDGEYTIEISNDYKVLTRSVTISTTKPVKELKY